MNNKDKACKLWQKGYKLKDYGARELILKNCGKTEYNEFMFKEDIDTEPKFTFKDKELPIKVESELNPKLKYLLLKKVKNQRLLKNIKTKESF